MSRSKFSFSKNTALAFACGCLLTASFAFKKLVESPACAVSLLRQNVFYIGVENPISIVVSGVPAEQVKIDSENLTLKKGDGINYFVQATQVGEAKITVSGGSLNQIFKFRVKRIPDPVVKLGAIHRSKSMGNGEFKAQGGLAAVLENFDFEARCDIASFKIGYLAKQQDPVEKLNMGGRFNSDVQDLVNKAKPGDVYFFDEIKARCPGDVAARELGSLVFRIR